MGFVRYCYSCESYMWGFDICVKSAF